MNIGRKLFKKNSNSTPLKVTNVLCYNAASCIVTNNTMKGCKHPDCDVWCKYFECIVYMTI